MGVAMMDKIRHEYIRGTAQVKWFEDKVKEASLRWFEWAGERLQIHWIKDVKYGVAREEEKEDGYREDS